MENLGRFCARSKSQNTRQSEICFHALLGGGKREARLERVVYGAH